MDEIDQIYDEYEIASQISQTDFSHLTIDDFAMVEYDSEGAPFGMVMGVPVAINTKPPAKEPMQAEQPAQAEPSGSIGQDIDRGLVRGVQKASEALGDTLPLLGTPVDLVNKGLQEVGELIGVDLGSDKPVLGSEMIRDGVQAVIEFGNNLIPQQANEAYAEYVNQPPSSPVVQGLVEEITRFGVQAVTPAMYLKAFTVMSPFVRGLAWGGIADFINAQPSDEGAISAITKMVAGATPEERGAVANAIMQVVEKQESDPLIISKAREALDGMILGGSIEKGVELLVKAARQIPVDQLRQRIVDAGSRADDRLKSTMSGTTLSANPVGAMADMAVSAAGKVADYPNTINKLLYQTEAPPAVPEGQRKWTKASLARTMQEQAEESGQAITEYNDQTREILASRVADEAASALQREGNASDWYNSKIVEMNDTLRQLHPELADGSTEEGIFKAGLALTSNGSTVDYNLKAAEHIYKIFKETGRFPTDLASLEKAVGGFGQEGPTLIKQFKAVNSHIDEMGAENFVKFLNTKFTVRELNAMGYKVTGESMDFETYGSAIFGPKIGGGFFQNLRGNFDPVTFDRWWMASWGRWTGQPLLKNTAAARAKQLDRFREASGKKYTNPKAAIAAAKKVYATYKRNNFQPRTELNQAAQRLAEGATDKMREQPAGPTERKFMRDVAYAAVEKLREMGYNVTPADLQATVWYPEKELHGFYGIGSGRSAPDDYAAAAKRLLEARDAGK
nr:hypothetical protein [uncultured Mediterranean phage uvMED]